MDQLNDRQEADLAAMRAAQPSWLQDGLGVRGHGVTVHNSKAQLNWDSAPAFRRPNVDIPDPNLSASGTPAGGGGGSSTSTTPGPQGKKGDPGAPSTVPGPPGPPGPTNLAAVYAITSLKI